MSDVDDLATWLLVQLNDDAEGAGYLDETGLNGIESAAGEWARDYVGRAPAEVEAKRRILDLHAPVLVNFGDETACTECARAPINGRCMTLRLLALPYADRPGYREEWKP